MIAALRRLALGVAAGGIGLAALWLAGFVWFVHVARLDAPPPPRADGIVVLTGGAGRVREGLRLLADGQAPLLLVSGVAKHSDLAELAAEAGVSKPPAGEVTLGHAATSTRGNAMEAAAWARAHAMHSLIVVTATYHMPRALAEFATEMPGIALYPANVVPPALKRPSDLAVLRLLAGEYSKWIAASLGLSRLVPEEDAAARGTIAKTARGAIAKAARGAIARTG